MLGKVRQALLIVVFQNGTTGEIQAWFTNGTSRTGFNSVKEQSTLALILVPAPAAFIGD